MHGNIRHPGDRRVRRTDQRLHTAFLESVREHGAGATTVRDVARRAGVGRSTFYTHFGDLADLHAHWFAEFTAPGRAERRPLSFSRPFLEHAWHQRTLWSAAHRGPGGDAIRRSLRRGLMDLVRADLRRALPGRPAAEVEVATRFVGGAFIALLFWWIDSPTPLPPAVLDAHFHRLVAGALGGAMAVPRTTGSGR